MHVVHVCNVDCEFYVMYVNFVMCVRYATHGCYVRMYVRVLYECVYAMLCYVGELCMYVSVCFYVRTLCVYVTLCTLGYGGFVRVLCNSMLGCAM